MEQKHLATWFKVVSIILIGFGLLYFFFGLKIFSNNLPLIPHDVLLDWESALYGAIMTGWGVTLVLVGRIAFKRNDLDIFRALLYGLIVWLALEAISSAYLHVWFNVGVDIVVASLFSFPLIKGVLKKL